MNKKEIINADEKEKEKKYRKTEDKVRFTRFGLHLPNGIYEYYAERSKILGIPMTSLIISDLDEMITQRQAISNFPNLYEIYKEHNLNIVPKLFKESVINEQEQGQEEEV